MRVRICPTHEARLPFKNPTESDPDVIDARVWACTAGIVHATPEARPRPDRFPIDADWLPESASLQALTLVVGMDARAHGGTVQRLSIEGLARVARPHVHTHSCSHALPLDERSPRGLGGSETDMFPPGHQRVLPRCLGPPQDINFVLCKSDPTLTPLPGGERLCVSRSHEMEAPPNQQRRAWDTRLGHFAPASLAASGPTPEHSAALARPHIHRPDLSSTNLLVVFQRDSEREPSLPTPSPSEPAAQTKLVQQSWSQHERRNPT